MFVYLFIPKDIANPWTDMVLFYSQASNRFITISVKDEIEITPRKKLLIQKSFNFSFKIKIKSECH